MAQLHAIHRGVGALRPTNDVDLVLHVETSRGIAAEAANALESIGYAFAPSIDERSTIAHRLVRGTSRVDLVASATDVVDALVADQRAPADHTRANDDGQRAVPIRCADPQGGRVPDRPA